LYKDEVRALGEQLGLPRHLVWRHPFPGPGLAIRILASNGKIDENEHIKEKEKKAHRIAARAGYDLRVLPIKSVGVQGDERSYAYPVVVAGKCDWKKLEALSTKLTNEVPNLNRVVYLLSPKKLQNVKLMDKYMTRDRAELLRHADSVVTKVLRKYELYGEIWQMPVVMIPISLKGIDEETIVLRPVESTEAMTARFAILPKNAIDEMVSEITSILGIGAVVYDITHKPPATICWE
jgi:GMP synthase (glutamine-hydrolysing)